VVLTHRPVVEAEVDVDRSTGFVKLSNSEGDPDVLGCKSFAL
jgi:hypothetical protein